MIIARLQSYAAATAVCSFAFTACQALAAEPLNCTVIISAESGEDIFREGTCDRRIYPMSTFKLALAMMGYDAGILKNAQSPRWNYKTSFEGPPRVRHSFDPKGWQKDSIVWYSQEITRRLGMARFFDYVERFDYGNRDVTGGPGEIDGLTEAWLMSSLAISGDEQVRFLHRFLTGRLPISSDASRMVREIVPVFKGPDGWTVHGKTGSGRLRDHDGRPASDRPLGWFVGWAEKQGRKVIFARLLVAERAHDEPLSFRTRDGLISDLGTLLAEN